MCSEKVLKEKARKEKILRILKDEMEFATGCTEPAAIALTAAYAGSLVRNSGEEVLQIKVRASVNIIKNAMAAGIPGTPYKGMEYAAAIGAVGGEPIFLLQLISKVKPEDFGRAEKLVNQGCVLIEVAKSAERLYIEVEAAGLTHTARAVVARSHTNLDILEFDGKKAEYRETKDTEKQNVAATGITDTEAVPMTPEEIAEELSIEGIYQFVEKELEPQRDDIGIIRQSIGTNTAICDEGMEREYGLRIGRLLEKECRQGYRTKDMTTNAMIVTAAGADARMAGAPLPVVTNSGSGNQGITATMPVVATARWLKAEEDKMLRAVTLSNLTAIYIKSKFGRLSALCGATVAATGAACGITYLLGGGLEEIGYAIQNMMGNVTGMLCDGAKADCALKISTCVNAAVQAALMANRGMRVSNTDGIVEEDVEKTICNFSRLGNEGSAALDDIILKMMLAKGKNQ